MESLPDANERRAAQIHKKKSNGLVLSKFEKRFLAFAEKKLTLKNNLWNDLNDLRMCVKYGMSLVEFRGVNPFVDEDPMTIYSQLMANGDLDYGDDENDDYFKNYEKMCRALSIPEEECIIDMSPSLDDDLPIFAEQSVYAQVLDPCIHEHAEQVVLDYSHDEYLMPMETLEYTVLKNEPYDLEEEIMSSVQVMPQHLCEWIEHLKGQVRTNDVVLLRHKNVHDETDETYIVHIRSEDYLRDQNLQKQVHFALKRIGRQTIFNAALNVLSTHTPGYFSGSAQYRVRETIYTKIKEKLMNMFPGWMFHGRLKVQAMARALSPRDYETNIIQRLLLYIVEKESNTKSDLELLTLGAG